MSGDLRNWRVVRFCCTSGMCMDCRAVANGTKRKRVVQAGRLTEAAAHAIAHNWRSYDARAEPEPAAADEHPNI